MFRRRRGHRARRLPRRPVRALRTGVARFERRGDLADLDQAVAVARQAVEVAPSGHPDRAALLNNLGSALRARFERRGDLAGLDQAVELARQALAESPVDGPRYPTILSNLGAMLWEVGRREEALAVAMEAVAIPSLTSLGETP
ncbi:tetratricopeptide repeat protein [Streptomyces sp. NPDC018000]|uniref:tetratricopeptide repeat protein n=1 Tax=Streptomyces sp. NPDC018000 TaxID=3365028 RepID=UPI0037A578C6